MVKPKVVVTRKQFTEEMERLSKVSNLVIIDTPTPPTNKELKELISDFVKALLKDFKTKLIKSLKIPLVKI